MPHWQATSFNPTGVFVYGTLRSGFAPHRALALGLISARPAILRGYDMLHLPEGYPALFQADHDRPIHGELLTFDDLDGALARFDDYEGCRPGDPTSLYRRFVVSVHPVEQKEDLVGGDPVEEQSDPVERPHRGTTDPVEEPEDPVEEPEDPVEEPEDPVGEPEDPVEEQSDPVEEPEDPVGGQGSLTDPPSPVLAWCYVYAAQGRADALLRGAVEVFDGDWALFIGNLDE